MKRNTYWFTATALGIAMVAILYVATRGPAEPKYRGIGLTKWLNATVVTEKIVTREEWQVALDSACGPEMVPWLIALVQKRDGVLAHGHLQLYQKYAWARRCLPKPNIGGLHTARSNGARMLARLAPGTKLERKAAKAVLSMELSPDAGTKSLQYYWLGCFTNCPDVVVPVLLKGVTNVSTFDASVAALQRFGTAATPSLCKMALPEAGFIRPAELALEKIDPAEYRRLRDQKENGRQ